MIIFLSYAKEDSARVGQIYERLKEAGYQPWMDNHDISPGQDWKFAIQKAISICDAALVFLSSKSISKTGFVQVEIAGFLEQQKRRPEGSIYLIPVQTRFVRRSDPSGRFTIRGFVRSRWLGSRYCNA